jgi:hypothetical protein
MGNFQPIVQESTLRLTTKNGYGTGFFVAPGLVLTCYHIIKDAIDSGDQVQAVWNEQDYPLSIIHSFENPDIALLSISATKHPCLFLDQQEASVGQLLYAYGYPERDKDGSCIAPVAEGMAEKGRFLKLKEANVQNGFSGSPLLNTDTRKVCGMVIRRRDRKHSSQGGQPVYEPIGGLAMPSETIMERWSELSNHPSVAKAVFDLRAISELGLFISSFNQDLTAIDPWQAYEKISPLSQDSLNNILLAWAKRLHFSFSNLEESVVAASIHRLESSNSGVQEHDMRKYFLMPQNDMRLRILKDFSDLSYKRLAPFDDCIRLFLFLSTNDYSFLSTIPELIKRRFLEFAEGSVLTSISSLYE